MKICTFLTLVREFSYDTMLSESVTRVRRLGAFGVVVVVVAIVVLFTCCDIAK